MGRLLQIKEGATVQNKIRLTLEDVRKDMNSKGMRVSNKTIADSIESGIFPFGKILRKSDSGIRTIIIMRKDYEEWIDHYCSGEVKS